MQFNMIGNYHSWFVTKDLNEQYSTYNILKDLLPPGKMQLQQGGG